MSEGKIIRVFPRRTKATPDDDLAFTGNPSLFRPEPSTVDEVHVSVVFTWDIPEGERLAKSWARDYPVVKIGGPAMGSPAEKFVPGRYLRHGHVITSRGCPNRCNECLVPEREGRLRTLPITDGYRIHDNNLLACPPDHIEAVLDMLRRQPEHPVFCGGLEARLFDEQIARKLLALRSILYFAFDRPAEAYPVNRAILLIRRLTGWALGTIRSRVTVYVLCGHEGDTIEHAERRMEWVRSIGPRVYAMFYRGRDWTVTDREPRDWHNLCTRYNRLK